jgi:hypothetical protein
MPLTGYSNTITVTTLAFLDAYPGATVAYSLRKLRVGYTGSAIRVRRSSDNAEQDIGFSGNGDLNTSSLLSFVGLGNNGFVKTWYDQSGNGIDATQASNSAQPQIVSGGTMITRNGKSTMLFDGVNDKLATASALPINQIPMTILTLSYTTLNSNYYFIAGGADFATSNGYQYATALLLNNYYSEFKAVVSSPQASELYVTKSADYALLTNIVEGTTQYLYLNGSLGGSKSIALAAAASTIPLNIAGSSTNGAYFNGEINEVIVYNSGKLGNVSAMNIDLNNYYGIY